jgi:hypothetical protein
MLIHCGHSTVMELHYVYYKNYEDDNDYFVVEAL